MFRAQRTLFGQANEGLIESFDNNRGVSACRNKQDVVRNLLRIVLSGTGMLKKHCTMNINVIVTESKLIVTVFNFSQNK